MYSPDYKVKLDVYEGPMDLLVYLIKKADVDVFDIPIAKITDQYLEYIQWLERMNIDLAGDFLVMAATLAQIKSRMLLPVHPGEEDDEDPRSEISRPIIEYLQMKSVAEKLASRNLLGSETFSRDGARRMLTVDPDEEVIQVGLFELIDSFRRILDNLAPGHTVDFSTDAMSIKDRISEIVDVLEEKGSVCFEELFEGVVDKPMVVVTFLALLEMVKLGLVRIVQFVQSGTIRLFYQ